MTRGGTIAVIADDLSGAAEMAALAAAAGRRAEVHTRPGLRSSADVVCLDTDSRGLPPDDAALRAGEAAASARRHGIVRFFKKTDSVLRGNVLSEIYGLLFALDFRRSLFIPANPSRGRTIRGGRYFVGGVPLDRTAFADDPEHPARTADVAALLGGGAAVTLIGPEGPLPDVGLAVPDAATPADLARRAAQIDDDTLPAGAADFFSALLAGPWSKGPAGEAPPPRAPGVDGPTLLVCGSAAAGAGGRRRECAEAGLPVFTLEAPAGPDAVADALSRSGSAVLAVGSPPRTPGVGPRELLSRLTDLAAEVLSRTAAGRVLAEGGATGAALARRMGWERFAVTAAVGAGLAGLRPLGTESPVLFVKPGSYAWPQGWLPTAPQASAAR